MNTFMVYGLVVDYHRSEKMLQVVIKDGDCRHELLAFGGVARKLPIIRNGSRIVARASRKFNQKTGSQFWLLESVEITQLPPLEV